MRHSRPPYWTRATSGTLVLTEFTATRKGMCHHDDQNVWQAGYRLFSQLEPKNLAATQTLGRLELQHPARRMLLQLDLLRAVKR